MAGSASDRTLFERAEFFKDRSAMLWGGAIFFMTSLIAYVITSTIYGDAEGRALVSALQSTATYQGAALATGSLTIIGLMVTAMNTLNTVDREFDRDAYMNIYRITVYAAFLLGGSVLMLVILSMPVKEIDGIPEHWFMTYFWVLIVLVGGTAGMMVTMLLRLVDTVGLMLRAILPE